MPSVDPNYAYKGCYESTPKKDDEIEQNFGYSFTPKICVEFCKRHGHPYAALYGGYV